MQATSVLIIAQVHTLLAICSLVLRLSLPRDSLSLELHSNGMA